MGGNACACFWSAGCGSAQCSAADATRVALAALTNHRPLLPITTNNHHQRLQGSATLGVTTIKSGDSTTALTVEAGDGVAVDVSGSGSQSAVVVDSGNDAIAAIQISQVRSGSGRGEG